MFFNAAAISIRSFFEQFLTWKYAFYYKNKKEEIKTLAGEKSFSRRFNYVKNKLNTKNKNEIFQNDEKIIQRFIDEQHHINEFIHESYKFYVIKVDKESDEKISKFNEWVKNLKDILKAVKSDKIFNDFMNNFCEF